MEIRYDITEEDYRQVMSYYQIDAPDARRRARLDLIGPQALMLGLLGVALFAKGSGRVEVLFAFIPLGSAFFLALHFLCQYDLRRKVVREARQIYLNMHRAGRLSEQRLRIEPSGVDVETACLKARLQWEAITEITDTGRHFQLQTDTLYITLIPYSAFPDTQTARQFLDTARRYRDEAAGLDAMTDLPRLDGH